LFPNRVSTTELKRQTSVGVAVIIGGGDVVMGVWYAAVGGVEAVSFASAGAFGSSPSPASSDDLRRSLGVKSA
jgi:hypothetical protein